MTTERPDGDPPGRSWSLEFPPHEDENVQRRDQTWPSATTPLEAFPRLGDVPDLTKPKAKINGAWGWVPLVVPLLFIGALFFTPDIATTDEETSDDSATGFIVLLLYFAPYVAGSFFAFRGSRRGITWTLPVSALLFLFLLAWPIGEDAGPWIAGLVGFDVAAFGLHLAAVRLTRRPRGPDAVHMPFSG